MSRMIRRDNEFRGLQEDLNRLFGARLFGGFSGEETLSGNWSPRVDIFEDQNGIVVEADLPGVKPEEFKLSIENFKLTLSGERKFENESKGENWHRVERNYGSFTRTFTLPSTVSVDAVEADFKDGVLRVSLPKREEVKARNIQVQVKSEGAAKSVGAGSSAK